MTDAAERASRVRRGAGWFERPDRTLIVVGGSDRVRWTQGMVSNDVASLSADPARSGCYALLLTAKGRIVADLHVLHREGELWLELAACAAADALAHLDRLLIADDVTLAEARAAFHHAALEGPRAREILASAAGRELAIAPDACADVVLGGVETVVGAWGWSGETAYQLIAPAAGADAVRDAVFEAGAGELASEDAETLEVLRVEAGAPRLPSELGPDVLPSETGLVGRAVSPTKGCYTGQEIVARMESRAAAAHRLVGLAFEDAGAVGEGRVAPGADVAAEDGARIGEITSACFSQRAGAIALGYLRRAHAVPGAEVRVGAEKARVAELPFVGPAA